MNRAAFVDIRENHKLNRTEAILHRRVRHQLVGAGLNGARLGDNADNSYLLSVVILGFIGNDIADAVSFYSFRE